LKEITTVKHFWRGSLSFGRVGVGLPVTARWGLSGQGYAALHLYVALNCTSRKACRGASFHCIN